eukprot:1177393-Prorocentrum_minimum.AAC.2
MQSQEGRRYIPSVRTKRMRGGGIYPVCDPFAGGEPNVCSVRGEGRGGEGRGGGHLSRPSLRSRRKNCTRYFRSSMSVITMSAPRLFID